MWVEEDEVEGRRERPFCEPSEFGFRSGLSVFSVPRRGVVWLCVCRGRGRVGVVRPPFPVLLGVGSLAWTEWPMFFLIL